MKSAEEREGGKSPYSNKPRQETSTDVLYSSHTEKYQCFFLLHCTCVNEIYQTVKCSSEQCYPAIVHTTIFLSRQEVHQLVNCHLHQYLQHCKSHQRPLSFSSNISCTYRRIRREFWFPIYNFIALC